MPKAFKSYVKIDDGTVALVADKVELGLGITDACARVGVSLSTLENYTTGEAPKRLDWAQMLACARAGCIEYWIGRMRVAKKTGEVNAAHHMLYALDARFKDDKKGVQGQIVVQLIQADGRPLETRVVGQDGGAIAELPGAVAELPGDVTVLPGADVPRQRDIPGHGTPE